MLQGIPLRGKMDRGVVEWPGHLTGDQKGFHTSCGQLFWLISEFIPTPPQRQKYGYKKPIVLHNTSGSKNMLIIQARSKIIINEFSGMLLLLH